MNDRSPLPQRSFAAVLTRRYALFLLSFGVLIWLMALAEREGFAVGGNAAALAMLAAWSMRDILGRRAGREDDADLLGVPVGAAAFRFLRVSRDHRGEIVEHVDAHTDLVAVALGRAADLVAAGGTAGVVAHPRRWLEAAVQLPDVGQLGR